MSTLMHVEIDYCAEVKEGTSLLVLRVKSINHQKTINNKTMIKTKRTKSATTELRSCAKVEVAVLGSPPLISLIVSVDVKRH